MKKIFPFLLIFLLFLPGCSASSRQTSESSSIYLTAMDTVMLLTAYGPHRQEALECAQAEITALDSLLSVGNPNSEISRLNATGSGQLSEEIELLFSQALSLSRDTEGLFDPTVHPLVKLWGFYDKAYHVPTSQELSQVLERVDYRRVTFDPDTGAVTLGAGQSIDLGGIGKGFTSQRVTEIMKASGVTSAMLSLGGNIQCLGSKPDGSPWNIGIRNPWSQTGELYCAVQVQDQAVITSGGYERYFVEDGVTYLHILDPRTGFPAQSGLSSVSIVTSNGTLGDGLSTALYIMGLEKGSDYWRAHRDAFEAIFIADDGSLYATSGLQGRITSQETIQYIE